MNFHTFQPFQWFSNLSPTSFSNGATHADSSTWSPPKTLIFSLSFLHFLRADTLSTWPNSEAPLGADIESSSLSHISLITPHDSWTVHTNDEHLKKNYFLKKKNSLKTFHCVRAARSSLSSRSRNISRKTHSFATCLNYTLVLLIIRLFRWKKGFFESLPRVSSEREANKKKKRADSSRAIKFRSTHLK